MQADPPRSLFVTNLAWISIALAGAHSLMSLLQNFAYLVVPLPVLPAAGGELLPPLVLWMFAHMRSFMLASLLFGAFWLWASIDLMRRRAWARIAVVGILLFGIAATVVATLWQFYLFRFIGELLQPLADDGGQLADGVVVAVSVVVGVIALAVCWLLGWLAWRLLHPGIAREFQPTEAL